MSTAAAPCSGSRRSEIAAGARASFSAGLGMFPLGMAFGLLVIASQLPWWLAPALSVFAYAGSLEFLIIGMIVAATPLATIALTTLLVNFRHVFYAFSFPLHIVRNRFARTYSMYALTDESYAVTATNPSGWTPWRLMALQVCLQAYWVGGGLVGVFVGSLLPMQIEGLEFALCALFVTLTLDACRTRAQLGSLLIAGACFALAMVLVPQAGLFAGLVLFVGVLTARHLFSGHADHGSDASDDGRAYENA